EGINLGAMAGTVELLQRVYAGIETRNEVLWLNPCLPEELKEVRLRVRYRGIWLQLNINKHKARVVVEKCWSTPARIGFRDEIHTLEQGEQREFELGRRAESAACE
ncbi:MAG: glycosyl hydrolase family 65 protein, partial [Candidatus Hydrogenedentales bacterium]